MNTNTFIEFMDCIDGWWVGGYMDYNIKVDGDDILVSKGIDIGLNPVLYERVQSERNVDGWPGRYVPAFLCHYGAFQSFISK